MKKISPSTKLMEIITDYQLDQIFPGDCLSQLDLVLYQAGEYICRQGSDQDVIPYFLKGRLKIVHSLENGSDTILEIQEKPGLLGEIELLLDRVCITSVIADQDSLVVQLSARHFKDRPFCVLRPRPWLRNCTRSTIWLLPTFIIRSRNASLLILWNIAMKMGPSSPR